MDSESIVREIKRKGTGPVRYRAGWGSWIKPAWAVRRLVENDRWMVSEAVRKIVKSLNLHPPDLAFRSVRAAYYEIRGKKWEEEPK